MANPSMNQAARVATALTFTNVTTSETARQAVVLQGSVAVPPNMRLDGYTLMRTGGSDGEVISTVRFWDASSSGVNVYQNTHTLSANNDSAGVLDMRLPLNSATFSQLNVSLQNDTGTTQDYTLQVYLRSIVD
jgi:hypothetical protein